MFELHSCRSDAELQLCLLFADKMCRGMKITGAAVQLVEVCEERQSEHKLSQTEAM